MHPSPQTGLNFHVPSPPLKRSVQETNMFRVKRQTAWLTAKTDRSVPTASSKPTLLPQLLAINPQHERCRDTQPQRHEAEYTVPPAVAQGSVHLRREQREAEARETPQHRRCSDRTGREGGVGVYEVDLDGLEGDDDPGCEDGCADVGHDPMGAVLGRPAVEEETRGHESGGRDHERDAEFGPALPVGAAGFQSPVDGVVERGTDLGAEEEADPEADIVEAADAEIFLIVLYPEGWEG